MENDANYQVSPRGCDYARDPPMGYLTLYIHLDIQPIGRMSRYDSTWPWACVKRYGSIPRDSVKDLSDREPINNEDNFFCVVGEIMNREEIFIFRSKMDKYHCTEWNYKNLASVFTLRIIKAKAHAPHGCSRRPTVPP